MEIAELLTRGVAEVLVEAELRARLQRGDKLRLKQGFDPSRPQMHLGNAVGLRKLRAFQELGHQVVLIVGDWTAQIGDPSGRDETRPRLTAEMVQANARTYMEQFFQVVDRAQTEVRWQSEWYGSFNFEFALNLAGRFTLAQMLAHETFRKRYDSGAAITILELMYPMLQGYDSVAVQADVEFGGTDQKFNNLAGRELQAQMGMQPQHVLLVPLIPGTDGRKMGKSFDNTIDITMPPTEMYGKLMSMSDDVLPIYFEVLSTVTTSELLIIKEQLTEKRVNPRDLKMRLARDLVTQFHSPADATAAEEAFVQQFVRRELPTDIPLYPIEQPTNIVDLLVASGLTQSKGEARRLITGGGVRVNEAKVEDAGLILQPGSETVVQVGKRKFVKIQ